ncbi:MAG: hypothetical protein KAY32_01860 [Candidatus Eisenbacteria sp.]|nr:hypothetical protein [Candidatus Eisenbacteria bacterium]
MEPFETRSLRAQTPWGELALQLRSAPHPGAALILDGAFLMDSDAAESERRLAQRGLAVWEGRRAHQGPDVQEGSRSQPGCRVMVAGLGLGLTLRALLAQPGVARVDVVELFPQVVAWNRRELAELNGRALADARVSVHVGDLRGFLEAARRGGRPAGLGAYYLVLLDIDNGPTWLSLPANAWLYDPEGFARLQAVLAPGGLVAYWATEPCPEFEALLEARVAEDGGQSAWSRESVVYEPEGMDRTLGPGRRMESYLYFLEWRG